MENEIDRSIIENTGVSIQKLAKSLNETVKVLGDIKKTLKESAAKSVESKSAMTTGGGEGKSIKKSQARQDKFNAMAKATQVIDDTWDEYKAKKKKNDDKKASLQQINESTGSTSETKSTGVSREHPNIISSSNTLQEAIAPNIPDKPVSSSQTIADIVLSAKTGGLGENTDVPSSSNTLQEAIAPNIPDKPISYSQNLEDIVLSAKQAGEEIKQIDDEVTKKSIENNEIKKKSAEETYENITESIKIGCEAAIEIGKSFNDISKAAIEEEKTAAEEKNEKEKRVLQDKYDKGLISKKDYDKGIEKSDKELADKKADLAKKQAARDMAMGIFEIALNTAVAIMKIWADVPKLDFGVSTVALTAVAAAVGAAQIAAVCAAPLPKARKGGVIVGGSHEQGGVLIEAEGGEAILSRAAMSAFPGVANLMNAAALSGGINDGGYAARSMASGSVEFGNRGGASSSQAIDYERLSSMMSEKMSQTKLFVAVTDINDGQRNYARISDMAKL